MRVFKQIFMKTTDACSKPLGVYTRISELTTEIVH